MWTRESPGLCERKGARYPSDWSEAEWALIPPAKRGGRLHGFGRRTDFAARNDMSSFLLAQE